MEGFSFLAALGTAPCDCVIPAFSSVLASTVDLTRSWACFVGFLVVMLGVPFVADDAFLACS